MKSITFLFIVKIISCVQFSSCHTSDENFLTSNFSQTTVVGKFGKLTLQAFGERKFGELVDQPIVSLFFPFFFVVAEKATTKKNGKKRSGNARLWASNS